MSSSSAGTGIGPWDKLWDHLPTQRQEEQQLGRERSGPRWLRLCDRLNAVFGGVKGLRVVELGSGRGDMSALLASAGARVTLVDMSSKVLGQARRRFDSLGLRGRFVQADMFDFAVEHRGEFDLSVSLGVVEHFRGSERTRAIGVHSEVLRPGGMTMISVPHAACLPYRLWKLYLEIRGWWPYGMEIPYGKREMRGRAVEAGLTDVELFAYGFWQSVGDHWGRSIFHRNCDYSGRKSLLDNSMGSNLVLFAQRDALQRS